MVEEEDKAEQEEEEEEEEEVSPLPAKRSKRLQVGTVIAGDHIAGNVAAAGEVEQSVAEERRLAKMMLSKKRKRLYEQIVYTQKRKAAKVKRLRQKREEYERSKVTRPTTT